jgi:hypothetical protein
MCPTPLVKTHYIFTPSGKGLRARKTLGSNLTFIKKSGGLRMAGPVKFPALS